MNFKTLLTSQHENVFEIRINRPEAENAINGELLTEMHKVLDQIENLDEIKTIVLRGENSIFCTGMDFTEVIQEENTETDQRAFAEAYMGVLKRFASFPKIIVSICEGKVLAGGVGFAAACDVVIATPQSEFGLSEALWGLLPANVMPYLIRRVGFQAAYLMTLSTKNISAEKAQDIRLVDVLSENPDKEFKLLNQRFSKLHPQTVQKMKAYFRRMWIITEEMEKLAIDTLVELKMDPMVKDNIKNFITKGRFPWEEK